MQVFIRSQVCGIAAVELLLQTAGVRSQPEKTVEIAVASMVSHILKRG